MQHSLTTPRSAVGARFQRDPLRSTRAGRLNAATRNLHDHVIRHLGREIVTGGMRAGDVLPREELLAKQLAVSRPALREAMRVLAAKGLVESRPKFGTRVRDARFWHQLDSDVLAWRCESIDTGDFVRKLIEMRAVIEPAAAGIAAERCSAEQLQMLDAAYAAMAAARNLEEWAAADLEFHEAMLDATNNELMSALYAVVANSLEALFSVSAKKGKDFKRSLPRHQHVLEAIRRRQPKAARLAMQKIIAASRESMIGKRGTMVGA